MISRKLLLLAVVALIAPAARADVKLHQLFTDNMVFQRDTKNAVWGTAEPGESIGVQLGHPDGKVYGPVVAKADEKGNWKAELPPVPAGTGFVLSAKGDKNIDKTITLKNVAVGEVWICSGQSNMEWRFNLLRGGYDMAEKAVNKNIRLFTVPKTAKADPQTEIAKGQPHETKWLESDKDSVFTFSAVAYYFGRNLQPSLNVPVGLIHTSWGGTPAEAWTSQETLAATNEIKHYIGRREQMITQAAGKGLNPHTPASLYNGMIHPLLPYSIRGAIWYQGESNAGRAAEYRTLFPAMIEDWRKQFKNDLPFFLVQLAPYHAGDADGVAYAELRDAQLYSTKKLKNVGMAVITDVGDLFDIHPQHKEPVGTRLSLAARAMVYGQKLEYSGPTFKEMTVEGDKAVLSFDHLGGGLVARGGNAVNGFTICGEDRYFYPAKAVVKGDTVVVSCEKVAKPVAVRYGWSNFPVCNLSNRANLPASPFRTDDFRLTTAPKTKEEK